jgi:hypothetical protein
MVNRSRWRIVLLAAGCGLVSTIVSAREIKVETIRDEHANFSA